MIDDSDKDEKSAILLIDDEVSITKALTRLLHRHYQITCCHSGEEAIAAMENNRYTVIISDMKMPQMDGATLLSIAKTMQPDAVRILLTGYSDLTSTIRAINEGQIFSYISKPWENAQLSLTLRSAVERFELQQKLNQLNQQLLDQNELLRQANHTLEDKVEQRTHQLKHSNQRLINAAQKQRTLMQSLLDMVNGIINDRISNESGHNKRVAFQCRLVAESQQLDRSECTRIYLAALMADLGKVAISDDIIGLNEQQHDAAQSHIYQQYPIKGAELLSHLPNLEAVATIIKHHNEYFNGSGYPDKLKQQDIPIGSRIIAIVKDYDRLLLGLKRQQKLSPQQAQDLLQQNAARRYDPTLVSAFITLLKALPTQQQHNFDCAVSSSQLQVDTVLAQNVT